MIIVKLPCTSKLKQLKDNKFACTPSRRTLKFNHSTTSAITVSLRRAYEASPRGREKKKVKFTRDPLYNTEGIRDHFRRLFFLFERQKNVEASQTEWESRDKAKKAVMHMCGRLILRSQREDVA